MLKKLNKSNSEGFTIIEVMIVLAIAGLILLIVFLAVPALQRNSRNTQRKNDAAHLGSLISEYMSNNNGKPPTKADFNTPVNAGELDATGEHFSIIDTTANLTISNLPAGAVPVPGADTVAIYAKATCTNNAPVAATSTRSIVVYFGLEGATKANCITSG